MFTEKLSDFVVYLVSEDAVHHLLLSVILSLLHFPCLTSVPCLISIMKVAVCEPVWLYDLSVAF